MSRSEATLINIQIVVLVIALDKWNNSLVRYYSFNCIYKNMKLHKYPQYTRLKNFKYILTL